MILSHGQSSIERGFLINKKISDNNLQEKSLISQRLIYDHFASESIALHEYVYLKKKKTTTTCKLANGRYKLKNRNNGKKQKTKIEIRRNSNCSKK